MLWLGGRDKSAVSKLLARNSVHYRQDEVLYRRGKHQRGRGTTALCVSTNQITVHVVEYEGQLRGVPPHVHR